MDIDPRARAHLSEQFRGMPVLSETDLSAVAPGTFDIIFAKEVIEHIMDSESWVKDLISKLKPGGALLLTTPNYGLSLLPLVEYTLLELIARRSGYSRFGIHPNKYSRSKLKKELQRCAPTEAQVEVSTTSIGMALVARVQLPH